MIQKTVQKNSNNEQACLNALLCNLDTGIYRMNSEHLVYIQKNSVDDLLMSGFDRELYNISAGQSVNLIIEPETKICSRVELLVELKTKRQTTVIPKNFEECVKQNIMGRPVSKGKRFVINNGSTFILNVRLHSGDIITEDTRIICHYEESPLLIVENTRVLKDFSYSDLEIGGLDSQFKEIFERIFLTRLLPPDVLKRIHRKHTKGLILYGPPGCGKTLLARKIGNILHCKTLKIVNGPEMLNRYVGTSEENIRNLFAESRKDPSGLHVIVFDEIDSLCQSRSSASNEAGNRVVNQLLTMIDGVTEQDNILVIGLTNRFDLLDEALLRAGRLEVHIKVDYPNAVARRQIFDIHTRSLINEGWIDPDNMNWNELVNQTEGKSGADIEAIVNKAMQRAIMRKIGDLDLEDLGELDLTVTVREGISIVMDDFR